MRTMRNGRVELIDPNHHKTPPTQRRESTADGNDGTISIDVRRLELELRSAVQGEVRFGDGDRGMYASDAGNYRMVPIGVVLPTDAEDVHADARGVPHIRRADRRARRRHRHSRPNRKCRGLARLLEVHEPDRRDEPEQTIRAGRAGDRARRTAKCRGRARADVRSRSGDAQPQHARRHDRQQLLRHSLDDGRRTVDNIEELDIVLYDGTRMTVGADERRGTRRGSSAKADERARSTAAQERCATSTRTGSARSSR